MTPERWAEVGRLFDAAQALPSDRRDAFLERECADEALRREVASLLSHDGDDSFLETPPAAVRGGEPPRGVGPYELVRELGRGGMGVVWEAVRRDQGFTRRVALKLVKRGMDTDFILARFENERRILAGLEHPNIARVLDGGSTDDGLPYFVMELIVGRDLLTFCAERRLPPAARLVLFRQVASAVAYAHRRLVVHRDLKPGNILVTEEGVPKLLDFGLAKVLDDAEAGAKTRAELRVLTPEYASPEQLRGEALTTATDVYSLGVVLHELLTGERAPRPRGHAAALHPDLDAIVRMALRSEPERRYASVERLDADVRRHLEGLPVLARPEGFRYRAGKFAARHRVPLAAGALAAASLVGALLVSLVETRAAHAERDRARIEAARAQETARFLSDLFQAANPVDARGKTLTAREILDRSTERIGRELSAEPEVEAALLLVMADAYDRLSDPTRALALAERSLALRERSASVSRAELAQSLHTVGRQRRRLGRAADALPPLERAGALREELRGPSRAALAATLRERALVLGELGRGAESRAMLERAVAVQLEAAPRSAALALIYNSLATILHLSGDRAGARRAYEHSIRVYDEQPEPANWGAAMPLVNLGTLLREDESLDEADRLFARALAIDEKMFGPDSTSSAYTTACLADLALAKGDRPRARELADAALRVYDRRVPPDHPEVAAPVQTLATLALDAGRVEEAKALFARALRIREHQHGPDHPDVADALVDLARAARAAREPAEAERLLRRALAIQRARLAPRHRALAPTLTELGGVLADSGRAAEACPLLAEAVSIARGTLPEHHSQRRAAEELQRTCDAAPR